MFRYLFLMIQQIITHKPTRLFMILGAFFAANAIIAEIVGVKIFFSTIKKKRLIFQCKFFYTYLSRTFTSVV